MRRVIPVMAMVGALWTADLIAQGRNFAGNWTVDVERTSAANAAAMAAGGGGGARGGRGAAGGGTMVAAAGTGTTVEQRRPPPARWLWPVAAAARGGGGAVGAAPAGAGMRSGGGPTPTVISVDAGSFKIGSGENVTTYKTDGSVQTITTPRGEVKAKAAWKGDKLVIETTSEGPNGPLTSTNTWYLDGEVARPRDELHHAGRPDDREKDVLQEELNIG